MTLGMVFGSVGSGYFSKRFGRKRPLFITFVFHAIAWGIMAGAQNFHTLVAGAVVHGLSAGARDTFSRSYMVEVAHTRYRGQFLSSLFMMAVFSSLIEYAVALVLDWRGLAVFVAVFPFALVPFQWGLPESHPWLLSKGRVEEARAAIQWFYGDNYDCAKEFDDCVRHQEETAKAMTSYRDALKLQYLKPVFLVAVIMFLRIFSGGTVILMYLSQVFRTSNSVLDPRYAVIILGAVQVVALFIAGRMFDKIGRKKSVLISGIVTGTAEAAMGAYLYLDEKPEFRHISQRYSWLPLPFLGLSLIGFCLGIASVMFVLIGEMVPIQVRDIMTGVLIAINGACLFLGVASLHFFFTTIQPSGTFWLYSSCSFLLVIFIQWMVPETKGQSLGEIERKLTTKTKLVQDNA